MGQGMDNWMAGNDGLGESYAEVIGCSHSLVSSIPVHAPNGPPQGNGIVWFSSCTIDDDSDSMKAYQAHKKFPEVMSKMGGEGQSWLM